MPQVIDSKETVRRGQAIYDNHLRAILEPDNRGSFLAINVETGEYVMDADDLVVSRLARDRFGDAPRLVLRIGHPATYYMGAYQPLGAE